MNNEIQSLEFEGNKVRTAQDENGNPLFCGTDVAQVLGYANPAKAVINHCKGFPIRKPLETAGGIQQVRFISEDDLYRLITSSKLPRGGALREMGVRRGAAFDSQAWRVHGRPGTDDTRTDGARQPEMAAIQSRRTGEKLKAQEGKVLFANAVESAKTSILVGDLAKILKGNGVDIGQKRLFAWLREHGWLIKAKGSSWNMPTQKSMDLGLFEIKETTVTHADGHTTINKTPKVTGKGQTYFTNLFLKPTLEAGA